MLYLWNVFLKKILLFIVKLKKLCDYQTEGKFWQVFFFFFQEQNLIFSTFMQLYCYIVLKSIGSSSSNAVERLFRNKSC